METNSKPENQPKMVFIDDYGLLGSNFYFHKYAAHGLTKEDIEKVGLTTDRVQVSEKIINPLISVDAELRTYGYRMFIKEGYRSEALYRIVYDRRVEKYGKEKTDALFNMKDMPHAKGLSVDVSIVDANSGKEIYMRRGEDGNDALFIDFYKGKEDLESRKYQELQDLLIGIMIKNGFRIGTKREYFHFDYNPDLAPNY